MAVDIKQAIQELIVPDLRDIKSGVKVLQTEIKRLDEKIDTQGAKLDDKISSLRNEIDTHNAKLDDKISSLRNEMLSLRNEMLSEFRRLDERVDLTVHVRERLMSLETRMAAYENRT